MSPTWCPRGFWSSPQCSPWRSAATCERRTAMLSNRYVRSVFMPHEDFEDCHVRGPRLRREGHLRRRLEELPHLKGFAPLNLMGLPLSMAMAVYGVLISGCPGS